MIQVPPVRSGLTSRTPESLEALLGSAVAFLVVGLGVGVLSGMLGIGGGTILVPVFKLGFGLPALGATATSLFTIIPTSISGVISHIRKGTCVVRLGVAAGLGGALTSPLGVWLSSQSPEWATMVACAVVIAYSASTMLTKAVKLWRAQRATVPSSDEPVLDTPSLDAPSGARSVITAGLIGLVAGVLSGYVGLGGGFLIIPLFMQLLNMPMKLTSGTSLMAVMMLAVPGTVTQALLGNVDWVAGICVALGAVPGAVLGTKLLERISEVRLRFLFGGFLLLASILLIVDQVL